MIRTVVFYIVPPSRSKLSTYIASFLNQNAAHLHSVHSYFEINLVYMIRPIATRRYSSY